MRENKLKKIKIRNVEMKNYYFKILYLLLKTIDRNFLKFNFLVGHIIKIKIPKIKHTLFLRLGSSDFFVFRQIFKENEYKIMFDDPKIIIDAGANIGFFAVLMKNKYPHAKVICIEPDPENFEILKKNISQYDHIYAENYGLWDKDTKLKVFDKHNLGYWGIIVEEDLTNGTIPAITINSLMKKYGFGYVDILKIDIEASEKQLFSNNFKSWLPLVNNIIIELHDGIESGCSKTFFEAINSVYTNYSFSIKGENVVIKKII